MQWDNWFNKCYKRAGLLVEGCKFISIAEKKQISNIKEFWNDVSFEFQQETDVTHFETNNLSKGDIKTVYESIKDYQRINYNLIRRKTKNWNLLDQSIREQIKT